MKLTTKLSRRDIGLLLVFFGILSAVLVYSSFYIPAQEEILAYESQIVSLREEEARYSEMEDKRDDYLAEIMVMDEKITSIIEEFPAGIQPETEIMYAVELEENVGVEISSIGYGYTSALVGENSSGIIAYVVPMSISYKTTYQGLKDVLNYTHDHTNRMVIDSISVSYDSTTGNVSGNLVNNMYFMTGTETVYEDPYVPDIDLGVDNIFGTIE